MVNPHGDPPETRRWIDDAPVIEVVLPRGDVTDGVVRIGDTVRRPPQDTSVAVAHYLDHLEAAGFCGSPRYLGRDDAGRDVLTFIAGDVAADSPEAWASADALLLSIADLVLDLHRAAAGFDDDGRLFSTEPHDPGQTLVTHMDVTPQNVVVRNGQGVGLIDFDLARRATPYLECRNTAMHWVPLRHPDDMHPAWRGIDQLRRLRLFVDRFGLSDDERRRFVADEVARSDRTWERMRWRAETQGGGWARMWNEGVGDTIRRRQSWLRANASDLTAALTR